MRLFDIIGLPESGKTTFLAALWFLLNRAPEQQCGWKALLDEFDSHYLDELVEKWLTYRDFGRTLREAETTIDLRMQSRVADAIVDLRLPDVAGERLQDLWIGRSSWRLDEQSPSGYIVFLDPNALQTPTLLDAEVEAQVRAVREQDLAAPCEVLPPVPPGAPFQWKPRNDPPQIQITYILQALAVARNEAGHAHTPLSVVMSAWDLVPEILGGKIMTASEAVERLYPLLYGFLLSARGFETRYFGVSAQGGPYPGLATTRAGRHDHLDRISIVSSSGASRDLTAVFEWMLSC